MNKLGLVRNVTHGILLTLASLGQCTCVPGPLTSFSSEVLRISNWQLGSFSAKGACHHSVSVAAIVLGICLENYGVRRVGKSHWFEGICGEVKLCLSCTFTCVINLKKQNENKNTFCRVGGAVDTSTRFVVWNLPNLETLSVVVRFNSNIDIALGHDFHASLNLVVLYRIRVNFKFWRGQKERVLPQQYRILTLFLSNMWWKGDLCDDVR